MKLFAQSIQIPFRAFDLKNCSWRTCCINCEQTKYQWRMQEANKIFIITLCMYECVHEKCIVIGRDGTNLISDNTVTHTFSFCAVRLFGFVYDSTFDLLHRIMLHIFRTILIDSTHSMRYSTSHFSFFFSVCCARSLKRE